jgi:glutaredoxin
MNIRVVLLSIFLSAFLTAIQSDAAFVNYTDSSGKIHYVNTDYAKVPNQYLNQVADQLKKIEADKAKTLPAIPIFNTPTDFTNTNIVSSATQITNQDRLTRLTNAVNTLQSNSLFPASVNINSGIISYIDNTGQRHPVTAESLPTVPLEFLPQIDQQISGLENMVLQSKSNKQLLKKIEPVEVFVKSGCTDCQRLEILLQTHKVEHFTYDIETSNLGIAFYKEMNNAPLPITRVGSKIIHGTNIHAIRQALYSNESP